MERIDPQTQERVWQRVRGEQQAATLEQTLMAMEAETAAQLQTLIRYFPGKRQLLQRMLAQTRQHLTCLQGIALLRQGGKLPHSTGKIKNNELTALVRKCYVNCLNLAAKYDAGSDDPEYGVAYAEMADTKRRHCTQLLSLLGSRK